MHDIADESSMEQRMRAALSALSLALALCATVTPAHAADGARPEVAAQAQRLQPKVLAWRRDIHQFPELGNREVRTAKLVADHLRSLGLEVRTGIATTGVVAVLTGGKPGPRIAIRADMDALPVTERVDLPFASRVTTTFRGETVGVMHACGHDAHTAILMGVAEALVAMKDTLPGEVLFVFQPAEEGPPDGRACSAISGRKRSSACTCSAPSTPARSAGAAVRRWPPPIASTSSSRADRRTARGPGAGSIRSSPRPT
jgi:amidohydrolase